MAGKESLPWVLLLSPLPPFFHDALARKFRLLIPSPPQHHSSLPIHHVLTTHSSSIQAIICTPFEPVDSAILDCLPHLRCIFAFSSGVNHIDLPECRRRGIAVANAGTAFSEDVADYAIGLLIDVLRRISASERYVRGGLWPQRGDYRPLGSKMSSRRVGIVGLGSIGMEIAKRLRPFGCRIAYTSRRRKPAVSFPFFSSTSDLASESDVLILSCPLTDETHHIINKDVLSALGNDGIIINIGRGSLIDEDELVRCLLQGDVGGAGLDVFENEPRVPPGLFALDNVVLSPHRAVLTPESFQSLLELAIGNLEAFFSNRPLLSPVEG